jgi:hypothetical protein
VEKVVEQDISKLNLTIKQPVAEKAFEQDSLVSPVSPLSPGVNTTLNFTIKSIQPVADKVVELSKVVEQDFSYVSPLSPNPTLNFTIIQPIVEIKQPIVEKAVEQDLSHVSPGSNPPLNFTIIQPIVEKEVEQDLSPGSNTTSNFAIKIKQPVVEKSVEQDLTPVSPGGNSTLNFTIKSKQPVVEKVDEGLSGGNGLNCTIKTKQVEKVVEEDLSNGNGTLNFSIKSKLKIPSM